MRVLRRARPAWARLLAFAAVYNLICAVLTVLAPHLQTTPERISLLDVLQLLRYGVIRLVAAAIVVQSNRPGRVQPRVVKRRPLQYSRMTQPRAVLKRALMKPGSG